MILQRRHIATVAAWIILITGGTQADGPTSPAPRPSDQAPACAGHRDLLPKYGEGPRCQALRDADAQFLAAMDRQYAGDRHKASDAAASLGWNAVAQNQNDEAMRRFNQAWLLDPRSGVPLWGMGVVQSNRQEHRDAMRLFSEASPRLGSSPRFQIDRARMLGISGTALKDPKITAEALGLFAAIHRKYPDNTANLQNWAITLYHLGRYAEAWQKVKLARATPGSAAISKPFLEALQAKLPEPK